MQSTEDVENLVSSSSGKNFAKIIGKIMEEHHKEKTGEVSLDGLINWSMWPTLISIYSKYFNGSIIVQYLIYSWICFRVMTHVIFSLNLYHCGYFKVH